MNGRVCHICRQDAPLRYWRCDGLRRRWVCGTTCRNVLVAHIRLARVRAAVAREEREGADGA